MNLVPMVVLVVLNYLVYRIVSKWVWQSFLNAFAGNAMDVLYAIRATLIHNSISRSHRRDSTMAALLFFIIIVFLLCHSTSLTLNVYEAIQVKLNQKTWSLWIVSKYLDGPVWYNPVLAWVGRQHDQVEPSHAGGKQLHQYSYLYSEGVLHLLFLIFLFQLQ